MAENKLADLSTKFVIQILKLTDGMVLDQYKGFEQGGSEAEENSPVDCFRRRGNERSEAIEPAGSEKSLALRQKDGFYRLFSFQGIRSRNNDWVSRKGAVAIM